MSGKSSQQKKDEFYMRKALNLAQKGAGTTSPNPHVGAIIVKNGNIIATGYHRKAGEPHAEAIAIERAGKKSRGADLYVNLEPCNHYGRTPPCTDRIVGAGIKRVVIGMRDPNPIAGGGVEKLQNAGVEVLTGVLEKEARFLNRHFIYWIKEKQPWVSIKSALTLDGKMATLSGDSKWITGEEARRDVHHWRKELDLVMVGINTVLKDDPQLTVRSIPTSHQPFRAVVDPHLKIPITAKILDNSAQTYVFYCTRYEDSEKIRKIKEKGHLPVAIKKCRDKIKVSEILSFLGSEDLIKIGVEGGGYLISEILEEKLGGELIIYYAPKIIGEGRDLYKTKKDKMSEAIMLKLFKTRKFRNGDIKLHYFFEKSFNTIFEGIR